MTKKQPKTKTQELTATRSPDGSPKQPRRACLKYRETETGVQLGSNYDDDLKGLQEIMASTGIDDPNLFEVFVKQMVNVTADGDQPDETALNGMLAVVRGIEPRDHLEAMLATQMAAVHNATMTYARRLNQSATLAQIDSAEKTFNKLARTFTTQMETLKRYRSGGQQTVTVQHVNVNDGGQAIVGNVSKGGGVE